MSMTSKWWLSAVLLLIPLAALAQPLRSAIGDIEVRTYAPPVPEWRSAQVIHDLIVREVRAASRDQSVAMTIDVVVGQFFELAGLVGVDRVHQVLHPLRRFQVPDVNERPEDISWSAPISPIRGAYLFLAKSLQPPEPPRFHCLVIHSLHEMCLEDTFSEAIERGQSRSSLVKRWITLQSFPPTSGTIAVYQQSIDPDWKVKNLSRCAKFGWPIDYDRTKPARFPNGIALRVSQCLNHATTAAFTQTTEHDDECKWIDRIRLPPPLECRH